MFKGRMNRYTAAEQKKLREEYKDSLGMGATASFSEKSFDALVNDIRRKDFSGFFRKPKEPEQLSATAVQIQEALKADSADNNLIKAGIGKALSLQPEENIIGPKYTLLDAQKEYTESVKAFKALLAQSPQKYSPAALIAEMTQYKQTAIAAIEKQHKLEKTALNNLLNNPNDTSFSDALRRSMKFPDGPAGDAQLAEAKKALTSDLEDGHKKQLEYFTDNNDKAIKVLHKSAQDRLREITYLANLSNDKAMAKIIDNLRKENETKLAKDAEAKTTLTGAPKQKLKASFDGISIDSLDTIKSVTGRNIKNEKNGSFSMDFGRHIFHASYYLDPRHNVTTDLKCMSDAVRASGYSKITMELNFNPQEMAEKRARQAFEACVRSGFPVDKITLVVNGVQYGSQVKNEKGLETNNIASELFKAHPNRYKSIARQANSIAKSLQEVDTISKQTLETQVKTHIDSPQLSETLKADLQALVQKGKQPVPTNDEPQLSGASPSA